MRKAIVGGLLAGTFLTTGLSPVYGQNAEVNQFPSKPVLIIAPGPGGLDVAVRLLSPALSSALGQNVIVENKPSGVIPGQTVARARPDGYTLLFIGGAHWLAPLLQKDVPYDPIKDFSPIAMVYTVPYVLIANERVPVNSIKELIALAKARPGELNMGASSPSSASTLAGTLFRDLADVSIVSIPYKAGSARAAALMSGEIQIDFVSGAEAAPIIKSGKTKPLGLSSRQPSAQFPGVPPIATTLTDYEAGSNTALFAPAKTPAAIVSRLNQQLIKVLDRPESRQSLVKLSAEPIGSTPQEAASFIQSDITRTARLLKAVGVTPM